MIRFTLIVLLALVSAAPALAETGLMVRGPLPTLEQAKAAFERNPDYRDEASALQTMLACVPAAWEDAEALPEAVEWWCLARAHPEGKGPLMTEFALEYDPKAARFDAVEGEFMGACPLASDARKDLSPMVKMSGVTHLYDSGLSFGHFAVNMGYDTQLPKALLKGPTFLFYCDYIGRRGKANYLLKTFLTYDAEGFHFTPHSFEQLFNDDGELIDQNGKVLDDQS